MEKKLLIDAAHPEETRVVVAESSQTHDFDFESNEKIQITGNIYLAKVTRVEPSLQAAFLDYGGNRHGFLAFSEIHPDYYQIPTADKEALLAEQIEAEKNDLEKEIDTESVEELDSTKNQTTSLEGSLGLNTENVSQQENTSATPGDSQDVVAEVLEEDPFPEKRLVQRKYKIQEVIKVRQILLVQVTKEERGNKGAALTTFLSLAGRYCVLMPNSANSGGISKKIPFRIRKKMKEIVSSLSIPKEMSVILRTAGSERTKSEIKRDYEYLYKLWQNIKNKTLESIAPLLIHEENHIIKRALRDYFSSDFSEILIEGEEGFKLGKAFMKTIMPSKVKLVKQYQANLPIFHHFGLENSINRIFKSEVSLISGGSIVITPTEALVSIDVNSGRSTNERDIESTALKTNIEAATEIARQLRLRDLGGLVVIDFIDMNIRKNNYTVENTLKKSVKKDRAKIQIGRISSFGLLEMSRQRLRPSLLEINYRSCDICDGLGLIRSIESKSLQIIRELELLVKDEFKENIKLEVNSKMAEYFLNNKNSIITKSWVNHKNKVSVLVNENYHADKFNITFDAVSQKEYTDRNKTKENLKTYKKEEVEVKKEKKKTLAAKKLKKIQKKEKKQEKPIKKLKNKISNKKVVDKKVKIKKNTDSKITKISNLKQQSSAKKKEKEEKIKKIPKKTGWWQT